MSSPDAPPSTANSFLVLVTLTTRLRVWTTHVTGATIRVKRAKLVLTAMPDVEAPRCRAIHRHFSAPRKEAAMSARSRTEDLAQQSRFAFQGTVQRLRATT